MDETRGIARALFAATLLVVGGVLNIIWGIAAIGKSDFFTQNAHYVFSDLKTWGWITLILGILELIASVSLVGGKLFGRWFAIGAACLSAVGSLLDIPAYPFWSIAVFALSVWIIHGLIIYGEPA
jgi:hypothetical protein